MKDFSRRATVAALLLVGSSAPVHAQAPTDIGDGWFRSVPADQGLDDATVREIFNRVRSQSDYRTVRGIVIVRHGTLVAEAYFGDFTSRTLKNVHSVSKSVTSLAVGIAIDRGLLPGVSTRLVHLLPHYAHRLREPPKNRLTLRHALTMIAGLAWSDTDQAFWNNADSVDYVLTRDVVAEPGAEFLYSSGLSHVIAEVNNRASGKSHLAFVQQHLFGPLGITTATWDPDLSGRHWGGTGLRIRPRDMAKIGQLTLQEGLWEGKRLVSREWIAESTRGQTAGIAEAPNYGYQWWIRPQGRYLAHGYNGQYIGVDPEADIVMTMITLSEQSPRPQETYRYYFEQLQDLAGEAMRPERRGRLAATAVAGGGDEDAITIEVRRVGGSDGAVTLAYGTRNGSARAGREFRRTEGELRWEHGDAKPQTVRIPLLPNAGNADFSAAEGQLMWKDGESGARLVHVSLMADDESERSELFDLVLSDESGTATFFSPENVELVFKLLDGRAINDHHWVYYGPLSDVEYWLTVTDTLHDRVVVYRNPPGEICGRGDSMAFGEPAGTVATSRETWNRQIEPAPNTSERIGSPADDGTCPPGTLCLLDGRFEVTAEWTGANGESGAATPLPGTDATGYMWFFSPGNIELAVKALDGVEINNAFWVFAAGLTDVDYRLTVADTVAGSSKTYSNPSRPFCGLGDTSAFPQ